MAKNINAERRACHTLELRMTDEETACMMVFFANETSVLTTAEQ